MIRFATTVCRRLIPHADSRGLISNVRSSTTRPGNSLFAVGSSLRSYCTGFGGLGTQSGSQRVNHSAGRSAAMHTIPQLDEFEERNVDCYLAAMTQYVNVHHSETAKNIPELHFIKVQLKSLQPKNLTLVQQQQYNQLITQIGHLLSSPATSAHDHDLK